MAGSGRPTFCPGSTEAKTTRKIRRQAHGCSLFQRRRHAALGGLLKRVSETNQAGLGTRHTREAHAEQRQFSRKLSGKGAFAGALGTVPKGTITVG